MGVALCFLSLDCNCRALNYVANRTPPPLYLSESFALTSDFYLFHRQTCFEVFFCVEKQLVFLYGFPDGQRRKLLYASNETFRHVKPITEQILLHRPSHSQSLSHCFHSVCNLRDGHQRSVRLDIWLHTQSSLFLLICLKVNRNLALLNTSKDSCFSICCICLEGRV